MKKSLLIWLFLVWIFTLVWCQKSDDDSINMDVDDNGRFAVAEWYCVDEWWELEMWEDGDGYRPVCFYEDDESYCYFEDLYDWLCHKWDLYTYYDDLYPYAEQACIDSNGQISQTEYGEDICILGDDEFCYMDDIMDWACDFLNYGVQEIYDMSESESGY